MKVKKTEEKVTGMYIMGMFEFKQYMNAADKLIEIEEEQARIIKNAYADIHPTRVHYDFFREDVFRELECGRLCYLAN